MEMTQWYAVISMLRVMFCAVICIVLVVRFATRSKTPADY